MSRFNNGTPGTGQGRFFGAGRANGCGLGLGLGRSQGQRQASQRDPEFFRRNCLGIAEQPGARDFPRNGRFESLIESLQRQIDDLKRQISK